MRGWEFRSSEHCLQALHAADAADAAFEGRGFPPLRQKKGATQRVPRRGTEQFFAGQGKAGPQTRCVRSG